MVQVRGKRRRRAAIALVTVGLVGAGFTTAAASAFAVGAVPRDVISLTTGAGEDGACTNVSAHGARQHWTFTVDHVYGNLSLARLHAEFDDGTTLSSQAPTDTGNFSAIWIVDTAAGAHVKDVSADVTDANPDGATLQLLSCELFADSVTTTTSTTTTVLAASASTTTVPAPQVSQAAPAAPVVAAPAALTG